MRFRTSVATGVVLGAAFLGCGGDDGNAVLREARAKALGAPYLSVARAGGQLLLFSPRLTVIRRRHRVVVVSGAAEEFTWDAKARCYHRHTDFNRDDARQEREGVAPPAAGDVDLRETDGMRVLSARERHTDFADTEFEVRLDRLGRPLTVRQRSAEWGVIPAGRWEIVAYRYPTPAQFSELLGAAPRPRCA